MVNKKALHRTQGNNEGTDAEFKQGTRKNL